MKDIIEALVRKSISEEQEAITSYINRKSQLEEYAKYDNEGNSNKLHIVISTLEDIINEEKIHVGQLTEMLNLFDIPFIYEEKGKEEALKEIKESL